MSKIAAFAQKVLRLLGETGSRKERQDWFLFFALPFSICDDDGRYKGVGVAPFGFTIYERKQVFSAHSLITCRSVYSLPLWHLALFMGCCDGRFRGPG